MTRPLLPAALAIALPAVVFLVLVWAANDGVTFASPTNDDFPGTTVESPPFTVDGTTADATYEAGEPHAGCGSGPSVWYTFVPETDVTLSVSAAGAGGFKPSLAVFVPAEFGGGGLVAFACTQERYSNYGEILPPLPLRFQAHAGDMLHLQVTTVQYYAGPQTGAFTLEIETITTVRNDDIDGAAVIPALPDERVADARDATMSVREPSPCVEGTTRNSLWYEYTATTDRVFIARARSEAFVYLAAYSGDPQELVAVGCAFHRKHALLGFHMTAGETYYIQAGEGHFYFDDSQTAGEIALSFEDYATSACPSFRIREAGATSQGRRLSLDIGTNSQSACFRINDDGGGELEELSGSLYFDVDDDRYTGEPFTLQSRCGTPGGLGVDMGLRFSSRTETVVVPVFPVGLGLAEEPPEYLPGAPPPAFAFVETSGRSVTVVVPLASIGGDQSFAVVVVPDAAPCIPGDAPGIYVKPPPRIPFGDTTCDFNVNGADAAEVLRYIGKVPLTNSGACAAVGEPLDEAFPASAAATIAGDVNCDRQIGVGDALLLLSRKAGLLTHPPGCPDIGDLP